jgi:hypothetical protein
MAVIQQVLETFFCLPVVQVTKLRLGFSSSV